MNINYYNMSERQNLLDLILSRGYLSKNMLARMTGNTLKDSGKLLESILPIDGVTPIYAVFKENKIILQKNFFPGAVIYAVEKDCNTIDCGKIEFEERSKYQHKNIISYPPADSGI